MNSRFLSLTLRDTTLSTFVAGLIAVIVGMTSSSILVFQAARGFGMSPQTASSWIGSICIGMGLISVILSIYYRIPVVTAWSTAGAALLIASSANYSQGEAIGAFFVCALLILLSGVTGLFARVMDKIPLPIASGLLAGVLLRFSLDTFASVKAQPLLILSMFAAYLIVRRLSPRLTMLGVLVIGAIVAFATHQLKFDQLEVSLTQFQAVAPVFTVGGILGLAIPLFIVAMASQNLSSIAIMRANGYHAPVSSLLIWTGGVSVITAAFGGFAISLAAITAAIAVGPEADPDPKKRYTAGVISGVFYIVIGIYAGTVTSVFGAFPAEMVVAIAGLALLSTIGSSLHTALNEAKHRDAAMITFAVTASGISLLGVSSAFWGVVAGLVAKFVLDSRKR